MDENENKAERHDGNELEARIVAWISGEASAFEIAELERLMTERPELAVFKRRIGDRPRPGGRGRAPGEGAAPAPGRSAAETSEGDRRSASGGAAEPKQEEEPVVVIYGRRQRTLYRWMMAAAACLVCALLFVTLLTPSFQQRRADQAEGEGGRSDAGRT